MGMARVPGHLGRQPPALLLLVGVAAGFLITQTGVAAEEAKSIPVSWMAEGPGCYEIVLDDNFRFWQQIPDDLNEVAFVDMPTGERLPSVLADGCRPSMYARYIITVPAGASGSVGIHPAMGPNIETVGEQAWPLGGNMSQLKPASLKKGDRVFGFDLELGGYGRAVVREADRLFPGGPAVERVIPRYNNPNAPILPCSLFAPDEAGGLGLRGFHVVTQPGGRAVMHEGYFYAYVTGFRLPDDPAAGRFTERALMWTRSKSLDGPWDKPKVLLTKQGAWKMIDCGCAVKLPDGTFVLTIRAIVGGLRGFYVLTSRSPAGFVLPENPPPPVIDATSFESILQPNDQLANQYIIKLTDQSSVGDIPGTRGAFVLYMEINQWHHWRNKWRVFGAYSTHPQAKADWAPMNGGRPIVSFSDEPHSAWVEGIANPKIMEIGPNQFVLGVNAYGQNLPEFKDKQDWRLWLGLSTDCRRFSAKDFDCVVSQYPGSGNHGGRIEDAYWALGSDEPLDSPLRIIYFAAPFSVQPTTESSNIYQANGPKPHLANDLAMATRSRTDRSYLHRKIPVNGPFDIELSVSARSTETYRGQMFLPAILDGPDPERAAGWAVVRDDMGQFQICQVEKGLTTSYWTPDGRTFASIPPRPEHTFAVRAGLWLTESRIVKGSKLLIGAGAVGFLVALGLWSRLNRRRKIIAGVLPLVAIAGAALALALPLLLLRDDDATYGYAWFGPRQVQQAVVKVQYDGKSLSFAVAGAQGRQWIEATVPARLKEDSHVFVGKTNSQGEAVATDLQYLVVHPPAKRLNLVSRQQSGS